jgi:hypothetical protein
MLWKTYSSLVDSSAVSADKGIIASLGRFARSTPSRYDAGHTRRKQSSQFAFGGVAGGRSGAGGSKRLESFGAQLSWLKLGQRRTS